MRIRVLFAALAIAAALTAPSTPASSQTRLMAAATPRHKAPIVLILMENHGYDQIVGVPDAPYLNAFAHAGVLLTNMYAVDHPSLPNYLALTGGSTFGCPDDKCPRNHYTSNNLFHQLQHTRRSWRSWDESMPHNCYTDRSGSPYAVRHNPAAYYTDLFPKGCPQWDVPYPKPLPKKLHDFTFITPNTCSDMHDCSVATGDAWLHAHVPPLLRRGAIVIIDFDEDHGNHIYCAIRGPGIRPGTRRTAAYTHYSLLAGLEDYFGLVRLHAARTARPVRI
jgi:phosphatidylinositol-3-phosphatase